MKGARYGSLGVDRLGAWGFCAAVALMGGAASPTAPSTGGEYAYGMLGAYSDRGVQLTIMVSPPKPAGDEVTAEVLMVLRPPLWEETMPRNARMHYATLPVSFACSRRTERMFPPTMWDTAGRAYPVRGKPEVGEWGQELPLQPPATGVDLFSYEVFRFVCGERPADRTFSTLDQALQFASLPAMAAAPPPYPFPWERRENPK